MLYLLFDPFVNYGFMRRALVACFALSLSTMPLGSFLLLRRMSLVGDALSHAILPGVAIGYLLSGMSLIAMGIGGFIAGLVVAILSGWVSTMTQLKDDASFAGFYLGSLALGVTLVSLCGSSVDLLHLLFGSILAVDANAIRFVGAIASITFLSLALIYRALVVEAFDATFLRVNHTDFPRLIQTLFLTLVVLNLVAGFQILGTLMSVGLMMLPSVAARCWTTSLPRMLALATVIGVFCSWGGLLWSFYASLPAGPTIVLSASLVFLFSALLGPRGGITLLLCQHRRIINKEMKRFTLSIVMALIVVSQTAQAKTVDAVASFSVLADIVRQVGGEHVKVTELVGPDGDPHAFEPVPKDSQALAKADVVFVSGLGLEGWIDRLVTASGYRGKVITASDGINPRKMKEDGKTITDPHAWNSASNGALYARNIMNALIAADPQDAGYFRQHGEVYIQQLEKLNAWVKAEFATIPQGKHKVLTSHDAFGYFGAEYGVQFLSPISFSTESEASASNVACLIDQIKQEHITTYFIENQIDQRLLKQIASANGALPGGELYPEALSGKDGPAATYEAAFRHNVTMLTRSMK